MPVERLPKRVARLFIEDILVPSWDPTGAVGYDPSAGTGDGAFLPVATTIDDVGAVYPSLVVSTSNETSGGDTSYDYLTTSGPGQQRDGQLVATVRAKDIDDGYTGDSQTYSAVSSKAIVRELINEVESVCLANNQGANTDLMYVGSFKGADAPDDTDQTPTVRIANCTIPYGWLRD